jgi:hypothetical protein
MSGLDPNFFPASEAAEAMACEPRPASSRSWIADSAKWPSEILFLPEESSRTWRWCRGCEQAA